MNKNQKTIVIAIVLLTIISIITVFKKDTNIVEKNKINKIERKEFSILKEQTYNGEDWKESNDTAFPTSGYLLNTTKTMCYDYNGKEIEYKPTQELTKGSIDGRVTIESNKTVYCELYFDIDNKVPEVNTFSITGKTSSGDTLNNGYTYGLDVTYKGNWLDDDVVQYCISSNNITCDNWTEISNKDVTVTSPSLTSGDGEKTMYIYLKDKANNVSTPSNKSITVDRTAPVVNTFKLTGKADTNQTLSSSTDYTHKVGITYNATIEESNIESYCVYEDNCDYKTTTSTTLNTSYTLKDTEGSHSVKIKVKDKAGNESDVSTQSITLDKTNPTATISKNTQDTSSITVIVGYEGQDSIIARQCRESGGSWVNASSSGSCTISNLSDGQTYKIEGRVRDASGRWNTDYPSVSVTTDKKGTPASDLLKNPPKGLTVTDCEGTKRFVGQCDAADNGCKEIVDNFVCFGYANESDCKVALANNEYIYRIIGITSKGEMKLIKNKALAQTYKWHNSKLDILWNKSDLFSDLNGTAYFSNLLSTWQGKIETYNWPNEDVGSKDFSGDADHNCATESSSAKIGGKIGLATLSDYYYSNGCNCASDNGWFCRAGWLSLRRSGLSPNQGDLEWLMGRSSLYDGMALGFRPSDGGVWYFDMDHNGSVRPVFYLSSDALISSGNGTSTDPFIIAK